VTIGEETETVKAGQALVVPGNSVRQLKAMEDTQAIVAMVVGGKAVAPGGDLITLPWTV
jgi:quercetin dioxygenase-like cupin family protein